MTDQVETLARRFAAELAAVFFTSGRDTVLHAINELNSTEEYKASGVCASHEYCDSNVPMMFAFEGVMGREVDFKSDSDIVLVNAAWTTARLNKFYV